MYRILRPILLRLWAWKKHITGNEPNWLFWEVNDWQPIMTLVATDKSICETLIFDILND